jgi:hypothetical protein
VALAILDHHPEFVADPLAERYIVTFNRRGCMRRVP